MVAGSTRRGTSPSQFSFWISSGPTVVRVENCGITAVTVRSGVPVVLVGHFVGSTDTFASDQILVKHSSTYKAEHPNRVRSSNGSIN